MFLIFCLKVTYCCCLKSFWTVTGDIDAVNVHAGNLFNTLFFNLLKGLIYRGSWFGAFLRFPVFTLLSYYSAASLCTAVILLTSQTQIHKHPFMWNLNCSTVWGYLCLSIFCFHTICSRTLLLSKTVGLFLWFLLVYGRTAFVQLGLTVVLENVSSLRWLNQVLNNINCS